MQSDTTDRASPRNNPRRQQHKQHRGNGVSQHADVLSDSNLPNTNTPRSKKTPTPGNHGDRSIAGVAHSHAHPSAASKGRPASAAAGNDNLATPSKPSYAGAAFHASPAPSSLPVPKFFSKSVPAVDAPTGLQARLERDGDRSDSNDSTAHTPTLFPAFKSAKSPLDMFFNADREEKAKKLPGPETRNASYNSRSQTPSKSREMFMLELDDTSSPVNSKAGAPALNRQKSAPDHVHHSQSPDDARRAAQTQSLKSFLNITANAATDGPASSPSRSPFTPSGHQDPSLHNNSLVTPSRPSDQLHYGNRNLSPLFQAATRSPQPQTSPHHLHSHRSTPSRGYENQQHVQQYAPVFADQYGTSPSKSPLPGTSQQYQNQQQATAGYPQGKTSSGPISSLPSQQQPQPHYGHAASNGASDMRSMEERMKRMLNMG